MLQRIEFDDFCIGAGMQYSVREWCNAAYAYLVKGIRWEGQGVDYKEYDEETGKCIVAVDPRCFRSTEVETLFGDPTKAKDKLGWVLDITFDEMMHDMMVADL